MKKLLFVFSLFILASPISAQEFGKIRGFVSDSLNGEVLPFANVFIEEFNRGASTDDLGSFLLTRIHANQPFELIVSFVGYKSKIITLAVPRDKIVELEIRLAPVSLQLQAVEKIGKRTELENETDIGLQRIDVRQLELLPKSVETDLFRSLQTVPGVQFVGDVSARYYVRGGASNQNLVLINGIPIYNPFHALGMFSVIDPEMINSVEFFKGGFSAEYGERLSSIMDIRTKDGNKFNYSTKASLSYLTGKVSVEGPIPYGSFMITGRKSFSTDILKKFFDGNNIPISFYDFSIKGHYLNPNFVKHGKFEVFAFRSEDKLDEEDPTHEEFNWTNEVYGLKWIQFYSNPFFSEVTLSLSKFQGEIIPNQSNARERRNKVTDFSFKVDATYTYDSGDVIGFGTHIKIFDTELYMINNLGSLIDSDDEGGNFTAYAKYRYLRHKDFGADVGFRFTLTGIAENAGFTLEPRSSFTYRVNPKLTLKGAWGIFQQEITTATDEREVISLYEPWMIIPGGTKIPRATHYSLGVDYNFSSQISSKVEGYYKSVRNLATVNNQKVFPTDPILISSSSKAYGAELQVKLNMYPVSITTGYSLSWVFIEINNNEYHPKYDSRHALSITSAIDLGKGWTLGAIWNYNSGRPFTEQIGYYNKFYINNLFLDWFWNSQIKPYLVLGNINEGRLPDYHRLDLSLTKVLPLGFAILTLELSVINVYNRENLFYFRRDSGKKVNMLPFLPTAGVKLEL